MDFYPPKEDQARIARYQKFERIFKGEHFDAFGIRKSDITRENKALNYLVCNFGALLSKLSADMLFQEFPKMTLLDGDDTWLESFKRSVKLKTQLYEAGLEGSYRGDVVLRLRAENGVLLMEDTHPGVFFPELNPDNTRAEPNAMVLGWVVSLGAGKRGVFLEKHYKGYILNELWEIDSAGQLVAKLQLQAYMPDKPDRVETGVDRFLVTHIPNYRIGSDFFGISDYNDLLSIMQAINNRMTRVDTILDKHGDPILAVPEGVLDADGEVNRAAFGVIEVDTANKEQMPQYIVWDAKLDSAFKEIEKLVEFLFMFSETSGAAFGLDKGGVAESGRALKYKLLRTLAKKKRREIYFDEGLKETIYTAQLFAKANNLKTRDGVLLTKAPAQLDITWFDGVIKDKQDSLDFESQKVKNGLGSKNEAIQHIDDVSKAEADSRLKDIEAEKKAAAPVAPTFEAKPRPFGVGLPADNGGVGNGKQ